VLALSVPGLGPHVTAAVSQPIELPIEVYPNDGRSAHVETVTIEISDATDIDSLAMTAHQPYYHLNGAFGDKEPSMDFLQSAADVRLNGGPWVAINNENVGCAWNDQLHGCVAGMHHAIAFTIPVDVLGTPTRGPNRLEFRFNGTDGIRSGWRVLHFGFMRPEDPSIEFFDGRKHGAHDVHVFTEDLGQDVPASYDDDANFRAGEALWNRTGILEELDGQPIEASCSSCHARDGSDLRYFGYSYRTTVARARGHGLSATEANQIASYVHSQDLTDRQGETYAPPGRPWNPPFQPGLCYGRGSDQSPDDVPAYWWAAGGGIDCVLRQEREGPGRKDMLAYLFPKNGNPANGVDYTADGRLNANHIAVGNDDSGRINLREIPITSQLPDWNKWLPDIHPMDAVPHKWANSGIQAAEAKMEEAIAEGSVDDISQAVKVYDLTARNGDQPPNADGIYASSWCCGNNGGEVASLAMRNYTMTRVNAAFIRHDRYGEAPSLNPNGRKPFTEPLGRVGHARLEFNAGPHINKDDNPFTAPYQYANQAQDVCHTHTWYYLQVVMNPGISDNASGQSPVDWGYQEMYTRACAAELGVDMTLRFAVSFLKELERHTNRWGVDGRGNDGVPGNVDDPGYDRGANATAIFPGPLLSSIQEPWHSPAWQKEPELCADFFTAYLKVWNDYFLDIPLKEWPRSDSNNEYFDTYSQGDETGAFGRKPRYQMSFLDGLHLLSTQCPGVDPSEVRRMAAWGDGMWGDDRDNSSQWSGDLLRLSNQLGGAVTSWSRSVRWDDIDNAATGRHAEPDVPAPLRRTSNPDTIDSALPKIEGHNRFPDEESQRDE
jgi:hypothetical protein